MIVVLMGGTFLPTRVLAQPSRDWLRWHPGQRLEASPLFHPTRFDESWLPVPDARPAQDIWLIAADGNLIHAW